MTRVPTIGLVDTGVNPWHPHVRGDVDGCRLHVDGDGRLREDGDFRDVTGHGTAVAAVLREAFPGARLFAVRVFDASFVTWPSLVARGILRAAAEGCDYINLSLGVAPGPGVEAIRRAVDAALHAGCVLVAADRPGCPGWLPASLPGVHAVRADARLRGTRVRRLDARRLAAAGFPRDLGGRGRAANFSGASFACARGLVHLARERSGVSRSR